jgi:LIM and senescent cell antigen-like-containing domain protein 1/2
MQVQVHVKTLENINTVQYTITCPVCKETIDTKEYVEANSSCFHQDCFKCNQCLEDFTKGEFYEVEDKLYCEFDFNIMFG